MNYDQQNSIQPEKLTSSEWAKYAEEQHGIEIIDHDGWDRLNFDYSFNEELITHNEFERRLIYSTVTIKRTNAE